MSIQNLPKYFALTLLVVSSHAHAQTAVFGAAWTGDQPRIQFGGGWNARRGWLSDDGVQSAIASGTSFGAYASDGRKLSDLIAERPESGEEEGGWFANARGSVSGASNQSRLVLAGIKRPFPRLGRVQNLKSPIYEKAIADLLRQYGTRVTKARLTQLMRVDLNGDKVDEMLISAHNQRKPKMRAAATDYAVAALRFLDVRSGKVKIVPLEIQAASHIKNGAAVLDFEILGCPDINGDGKQEIVVRSKYYEGVGLSAWSFDGRAVKKIASASSGL